MARILSEILNRVSASPLPSPTVFCCKSSSSQLLLSPHILTRRNRSDRPGKGRLVEVDLQSEGGEEDVEVMGVRKLEEAIHSIIVRRSAPDWLPFIPGSSYWVPPQRRDLGFVELIAKLTKPSPEEETNSFTTERGWPSSAYFLEGSAPVHPVPVELQVEVKVKVQDNSENTSLSEDEEG
ncbi:hypothetical protein NMG60_11023787 [Bertholletia excelsa]